MMSTLGLVLIIILILALFGTVPNWHGSGLGAPGIVTVILVIIVVLVLMGRL